MKCGDGHVDRHINLDFRLLLSLESIGSLVGHICLLRFTFLIPGEYGALLSVIKSSYSDSKQTSDNA